MGILQLLSDTWARLRLQEADTPLVRWGMLGIALVLVWYLIIEPLQLWRSSLELQVLQNAKKAVRLVAMKEQSESWAEAESQAFARLGEEMDALFTQPTDTAAQARMQELIDQKCRVRNITIVSQKLIAAEPEPYIGRKLMIAMDLRGTFEGMISLLIDLRESNPLLRIQNLVLKKEQGNTVLVQVVVAGYRAAAAEEQQGEI